MTNLYHYTTLTTLERILSSGTIRFHSLAKSNDWQEQFPDHGIVQGRHIFVSSWTEESEENPRMWREFCKPGPEEGVRLMLPVNPFSETENDLMRPVPLEYGLAKANYEMLVETIKSCYPGEVEVTFDGGDGPYDLIPYLQWLIKEYPDVATQLNEGSNAVQRDMTMADCFDVNELLHQVDYTDEPEKNYPWLYQTDEERVVWNLTDYAAVKNTSLSWQKEWRYIVSFYRLQAFQKNADGTLEWNDVSFDHYDLVLDPEKLAQLEVMTSPVMSAQSREKLEAILAKYLPGTRVVESGLKGL